MATRKKTRDAAASDDSKKSAVVELQDLNVKDIISVCWNCLILFYRLDLTLPTSQMNKDYPGITFTISNIQKKETTRGSGDALINVECSAKSLGPSFFYFLDIQKSIEIVQRPSQTASQANFMRGVFPSEPKAGDAQPSNLSLNAFHSSNFRSPFIR